MSQPLRKNPNAHRMLIRMPKALQATFLPPQIEAIEDALVPRTHAIDVRLLLPLCGKGAYLVLAAGANRRALSHGEPDAKPVTCGSACLLSQNYHDQLVISAQAKRLPNCCSECPPKLAQPFRQLKFRR